MSTRMQSVCGSVLVALAGGVCSAQTTVDWAAAAPNVWSNPAAWSPGIVPNNSGPSTFIARVLLPGAYTVTMDIDVTLSGFRFQAGGATLDLNGAGRSFVTTGTNVYDGIRVLGSAGSSVLSNGNNTFTGGGQLVSVGMFTLGGTNGFVDSDDLDICDTCVDFATGSGTGWSGTGDFILDNVVAHSELVNNGTMTVSGVGSRSIISTSAVNKFINNGKLIVNFDNVADTLSVTGAGMVNGVGGEIVLKRGKLVSDVLDSLGGGVLSGGKWRIEGDGELDLGTQMITTLETSVELAGAGSLFEAVNGVSTIGLDGRLAVLEGRDFTTDASGVFDVQGEVEVGEGSLFTVSQVGSTFLNVQGTALRGGRFVVAGRLALDAAVIDTIGTDLVLDGAGALESTGGTGNVLAGLSTIESGGVFTVRNGADFTTAGDLALDGGLRVGAGTTMDVTGDLSAFNSGVMTGGDIEVRGTLIADNARVERVGGRLVVGGGGEVRSRDTMGNPVDGLTALTEITASGEFGLVEGRVLDLTATNNTVTVRGSLILGASTGLEGPGNMGSMLAVDAYVQALGSDLLIGINSTSDFGQVITDSLTFGAGGAGDLAGTLTLSLGDGYTAVFGDEFLIFDLPSLAGLFGSGFASLVVDGTLGGGLSFEQFSSADGLGVRVIPAPGAGVLLAGGLLACRRRRG